MATSAELLKAIKGGAEVRIVFSSGDHGHTALEYSPRYKGDRQPWVKHVGSEAERYSAGQCVAVYPKPAVEQETAPVMNEEFDAKDAPACICTNHPGFQKYGYHLATCPTDTHTEENDDVTIKEGPLTERQVRIIEGLLAGKRHEEISRNLSTPDETVTVNVVKQECQNITAKFKAKTITQAVFIYSEAQAYRKAAAEILKTKIPVPFDEADEHANHVLEGLAKLYQGRHDAWMPA